MRHPDRSIVKPPSSPFKMPAYDEIALVLQGGGALGSYQAGVYEGLAEAGVHPGWVAGISIGALNTAIIAGNAPEDRADALRGFWQTICRQEDAFGYGGAWLFRSLGLTPLARKWSSAWAAMRAIAEGQQGFFSPRFPLPGPGASAPSEVSYYRTAALIGTLRQYADFERINRGDMRVSVGAVNVQTGNLVYFDNTQMKLRPEHFAASGALPPGFPAVEIDGEFYWDGGLVSNTPLTEVIKDSRHRDVLVFQVDLWSARGKLPADFFDIAERAKDIQYSSRTRAITSLMAENQRHARAIKELLGHIPESVQKDNPYFRHALDKADSGAVNVVHLIYENKQFESHYKDYEFSSETMTEHWESGLEDLRRSFLNPDWFEIPSHDLGFVTHDVHRVKTDQQSTVSQPSDFLGEAELTSAEILIDSGVRYEDDKIKRRVKAKGQGDVK